MNTSSSFYQTPVNPSSNFLSSAWAAFWSNTASYLLKSSEPLISEKRDRLGKTWFYIYDPVTNRTHCVGSESEAIAWMERNRY